jgi:phenylpropionate dioxygenase-like ring-hydroxylating dioxygenase large terminal subunit
MFNKPPRILSHISVMNTGNYVLPDYILHRENNTVELFHRHCPHRMYPLHETGEIVDKIHCKFHNFNWDENGKPIDNNKKLICGTAHVGRSNLVFKDFIEPDHKWVDDLSKETNLKYSHLFSGESNGSWLWLMDAEADLLHVYRNGIHPFLAEQIKLEDLKLDQGDGWIYQEHPSGWWVYIFPYTFIEYGYPGKLAVNRVFPKDENSEFGYTWVTQFYYDSVHPNDRLIFETMESVFKEDVKASSKQKGPYFPLMNSETIYESHCLHFGKWYRENVNKK